MPNSGDFRCAISPTEVSSNWLQRARFILYYCCDTHEVQMRWIFIALWKRNRERTFHRHFALRTNDGYCLAGRSTALQTDFYWWVSWRCSCVASDRSNASSTSSNSITKQSACSIRLFSQFIERVQSLASQNPCIIFLRRVIDVKLFLFLSRFDVLTFLFSLRFLNKRTLYQ